MFKSENFTSLNKIKSTGFKHAYIWNNVIYFAAFTRDKRSKCSKLNETVCITYTYREVIVILITCTGF